MKTINFYDTSSLLLMAEDLFKNNERFAIASITLEELENIKSSANKDSDIKYTARKLARLLNEHMGEYDVEFFNENMLKPISVLNLPVNNDTKIIACGLNYEKKLGFGKKISFITNDICLKHLANLFFTWVSSIEIKEDNYCGYKELILNEKELSDLYSNFNFNHFNLYINQYAVIKNELKEIVDILKWTGEKMERVIYKPFTSKWFGKISAYKNDPYQKMVLDSLNSNQLTVIRGPAGTGKSTLGFAYLFSLLENSIINKIYIFCNPVATKDSAKLGFYPGDKNTKLLDSQIGNFLIGKLGDPIYIEELISKGQLVLVPVADCRGMDISDNVGIYMTEAQNSTNALMKLLIQRIGENTKCVIEGDDLAQTDMATYEGSNNGLRRLSEVFRGEPYYGEITLKNCYRSRIAEKAEEM